MRSFIVLCFVTIGFLYGASTTSKIKSSKKNLSATSSAKKQASRKLGKIAKDIQSAEKDIVYLEKKMANLEEDKEKTQKQYEVLKVELKKSEAELLETGQELKAKAKVFISLLSEQFSIVFAMEHSHAPTQKSILSHEVYSAYKKQNAKVLSSLKSDILALKKSKKRKETLRNKRQNEIKRIIKKRESYAQKKAAKEKLRKKLSVDEEKYNAKLEKIEDKQNSLRATLAKLNILHAKEVDEARKRAAARKKAMRLEKERQRKVREAKALARAKARKAKEALRKATTKEEKAEARLAAKEAEVEEKKVYKESEKVRQVNSSYKKSQTYAYRGNKTISPLPGAKIIKKFGTYVDPIYKIKIFNESITLKAKTKNAKVKNVLNGKVVFSGKSSMLGNVVVVLHSRKIHTVYAGLSKIAPTIRVGSKIKKGYVVGKVNQKLIFQATKNSKHINPLRLIKI
ncbi:peptidoglycan DD-metalloendopeptidase family protein [Sulfurovum sp.]|uniref:murein hydrolase activator EnvC family protein n=1 Tax=Sulfurovum sp. TaxID=1969726 RepID=UPI002867C569|nr:peptidoglycan DD-metalloendopeptidase family protein [Sulfurovum sp.]